jgi:hypothetical protein
LSERLETMPLSVVLRSVGGAVVDGERRPALLAAVLDRSPAAAEVEGEARILVFPRPRRPHDDDPAAA